MDVSETREHTQAMVDSLSDAVIADQRFFELLLVGILARGHVLLEDVPGTGKTLTARSLASVLGLSFSRIQFTPDLLPTDVTGTHVFNEKDRSFEFREGPIFANVVLGDEINRAPPKTQAALLEAMEERQVTVGGDTFELPDPFFVIATQNPVESEGTFPLPEAQVDRFIIKTSLGYPDLDGEIELLSRRAGRAERSPAVEPILDGAADVTDLQSTPESVTVDEDLLEYIAELTRRTRDHQHVDVGISPRGTQRLFEAARANAAIAGRDFVTPDDITGIAVPVLAHRLVLTPDASVSGVSKAEVIEDILEEVPVPTVASSPS